MTQVQVPTLPARASEGAQLFITALHNHERLKTVRAIRRARRCRSEYFTAAFFGDPAWDMLLELYAAELEQRRISVSSLCDAAEVAQTTGLRWLDAFTKTCLVERRADPLDGRRIYVSFTPKGAAAMSAYFAAVSPAVPSR